MPVKYFKCECGEEARKIVKDDLASQGYRYNASKRSWTFDPSAPKVTPKPLTNACVCGKEVTESEDPKAVLSFVKFNFME